MVGGAFVSLWCEWVGTKGRGEGGQGVAHTGHACIFLRVMLVLAKVYPRAGLATDWLRGLPREGVWLLCEG